MDPRRRQRHTIMLALGYVLMAIALVLATTVVIFIAYGFGLKGGHVIQNGLVSVSSSPNPATIYIDGQKYKDTTNTKIVLTEGMHTIALKRQGYRDWSRTIETQGGTVASFDYPLLFPKNLTTTTFHTYASIPSLVSQSTDRRWLLVAQPGSIGSFDLYDLSNPKQVPITVAFPAGLLSKGANESLAVLAWAGDNEHILFKYTYDTSTSYLLFDRSAPDQSIDITKTLQLPTANIDLRLQNDASDHYWVYNTVTHDLLKAVLGGQTHVYLPNVLAFAVDGDNNVLYATPDTADPQKVIMALFDGTTTYVVRNAKAGTQYLLALAQRNNSMFAAMSAVSEGVAFVYKDPISQLSDPQLGVAIPVEVLSLQHAIGLSFSSSAQYILFTAGTSAISYDTDYDQSYHVTLAKTLDSPQATAWWFDDARYAYVTHGQLEVCDYDGQNCQLLMSADSRFTAYLDPSSKVLYSLIPATADHAQELLTDTPLRIPADQ